MPNMPTTGPELLAHLISPITKSIKGRPLDRELEHCLNSSYPADSPSVISIRQVCESAIQDGWMCNREQAGIKYGRVFKPTASTDDFSIDVVEMQSIAGPYHRHPNGEIDLVMPLAPGALFDGRGAGWLVYGPGSAHSPTVTHGAARILYLLPAGAIEFTRS